MKENMKEAMMKKYARLIAVTGVNIQKGQPAIITASVDQYPFVTYVVEACYEAGASWVRVDWSHHPLTRLHYNHHTLEQLSKVPAWREAQLQQVVDETPALIHILNDDPAGLAGIDQEKMQKARQASYPILRKYHDAYEYKCQWTIAAVPSPAWAMNVFPEAWEEQPWRACGRPS